MRYRIYFFLFVLLLFIIPSKAHTIISFEGNCGAGKSTLAKIVAQELTSATVITDYFSSWASISLFKQFLLDKKRWAFTLSIFSFTNRIMLLTEKIHQCQGNELLFLLDRSPYTQLYAFSPVFYHEGSMSALEWEVFKTQAELVLSSFAYMPHAVIYVRTSVETCYARIQKRRPGDSLFTKDYLATLHEAHEQWLLHHNLVSPAFGDTPVLIVDGNVDFQYDMSARQSTIKQIREFLQTIKMGKRKANEQQYSSPAGGLYNYSSE